MRKEEAAARRERVMKLIETGLPYPQIEELLLMPKGSVAILIHNLKKKNGSPDTPPEKN